MRQGVRAAGLRGVSSGSASVVYSAIIHPLSNQSGCTNGIARITDVIVANVGGNEPGLDHPAVFPLGLAEQLVRRSARWAIWSWTRSVVRSDAPGCEGVWASLLGIEREEKYVRIALGRLR